MLKLSFRAVLGVWLGILLVLLRWYVFIFMKNNTSFRVKKTPSSMAGTYSTGGASGCTACPAGTYSGTGWSGCNACATGTANPYTSQSSCPACAAGKYQSSTGQSYCNACAAGSYSGTGAVTCIGCPSGTYQVQNSTHPQT